MDMERLDALQDLLAFDKPISVLAHNLPKFDWDYEGQPLIVTASQVQKVLKRFLDEEVSTQELVDWANLIECREDLEFESGKHDKIANVIHILANPTIERMLTPEYCKELINILDG
tara:strand:- start:1555 stop:1902 length:348 start_codon:yes stop_codon:yes gene_type:complete